MTITKLTTARLKNAQSDSTIALLKLEDFPDFVSAREKLRELATEFNSATSELDDIDRNLNRLTQSLNDKIDAAARDRIDGRQTELRSHLQKNREDARLKVEVARRALELQTDAFEEVKNRRAEEIIALAKPVHRKMAEEVLARALALADVVEAEESFRLDLARDGVVSPLTRGAGVAFTPIPPAIRNGVERRRWSSPLNTFLRAVRGPGEHSE